jgi:hypothetical protein
MLLGIVGLSMVVFREHGWLQVLFSKLFQSTTSILIPLILFALWFVNRWLTSPHKSETAKYGDSPMYVIMAASSYYLLKLITSGSF